VRSVSSQKPALQRRSSESAVQPHGPCHDQRCHTLHYPPHPPTTQGGGALIRMQSMSEARAAIVALHNQHLPGAMAPLVVRFADSAEQKAKKAARMSRALDRWAMHTGHGGGGGSAGGGRPGWHGEPGSYSGDIRSGSGGGSDYGPVFDGPMRERESSIYIKYLPVTVRGFGGLLPGNTGEMGRGKLLLCCWAPLVLLPPTTHHLLRRPPPPTTGRQALPLRKVRSVRGRPQRQGDAGRRHRAVQGGGVCQLLRRRRRSPCCARYEQRTRGRPPPPRGGAGAAVVGRGGGAAAAPRHRLRW